MEEGIKFNLFCQHLILSEIPHHRTYPSMHQMLFQAQEIPFGTIFNTEKLLNFREL